MTRLYGLATILGTVLACALGASAAQASGFAIRENSAEALGTAFAGNASSADFLSTIFNNPAGMTHFSGDRAQLDASLIFPSSRFEGGATETCPHCSFLPFPFFSTPGTAAISGVGSGNAGQAAFVPAGYVMHSFSDDLKFGIAMTVPFGLSTIYPSDWVGRYFGVKSALETIDFNPNIAYRVNRWLSVGAGVSAQYMNADLTQAVDQNGIVGAPPVPFGPFPDGRLRVHGDDWGFGFNGGVLVEPMPGTSIGLTYRSRVRHTVEGSADFTGIAFPLSLNPLLQSSRARATIVTPDSADLSITQNITDQLHVAMDVQWTDWSVFKSLGVQRTSGVLAGANLSPATPENFRNTWFVALGGTYNWDEHWTFRAGVAYDETPVRSQFITVRLPDADRFWLAFGAGYKFSPGFSVDLGVAHIFIRDSNLNSSVNSTLLQPKSIDKISGKYANQVDLVSLQTRFRF
ncbi:MAG TPA: OmpP1/FadL family transporter [Stellaceae bacterium]|nr:OmpP1/FadL family transporter [Stellaceae bacterium]